MQEYDALIIGAGPAGLFAALAVSGARVGVLEGNSRAGCKLLLSGTGQCNFTHTGEAAEFLTHFGRNGRFLRFACAAFDNAKFTDFLLRRGVESVLRQDGKLFPACGKAVVIRDLLVKECLAAGADIYYGRSVAKVIRSQQGFTVSGEAFSMQARCLVLATGGMSYPATGSTGGGFILARELGHTLIPPTPALTPLIVRAFGYTACAGISFKERPVALWRDGRKIAAHRGDILLTHQGLSGPGILDISRYAQAGDLCTVELVAPEPLAELKRLILAGGGKKSLKGLLVATTDLAASFLDRLLAEGRRTGNLRAQETGAELNKAERKYLLGQLAAHPFVIARKGDYSKAMATAGGVALTEVNPKTLESKLLPGLFFAGELLDIDGDTGGYNIQAAASTGLAAGLGVTKRLLGGESVRP